MNQDVGVVLNTVNAEWANDMMVAKTRIAVLTEENIRLKKENQLLKKGREEMDEESSIEGKKIKVSKDTDVKYRPVKASEFAEGNAK